MVDLSALSDEELIQMLHQHPDIQSQQMGAALVQQAPKDAFTDVPEAPGSFSDFTRQLVHDSTFGLSDKANALAAATKHSVASALGNEKEQTRGFGDVYHDALAKEQERAAKYGENNPSILGVKVPLSTISSVLGMFGGAGPGGGVPAATMLGRTGQAAGAGATIGGLSGLGHSSDGSVAKTALDTAQGAGVGGLLGTGANVAGETVASPLADWASRRINPAAAIKSQGAQKIIEKMNQDKEGGGPTAQDMLDLLNEAPHKPQVLADVAGENVRGLAGKLVRQPGPARQIQTQFLKDRDIGAGSRLASDVNTDIGAGSSYDTGQALMDARSAASKPLYQKAGIPSDPAQFAQAPVIDTPEVKSLLEKSKDVQAAIAQAKRLPAYADLPDNNIVLLDKAYKYVGDMANEARIAGKGTASKDFNGLRIQLKDAITGGDAAHPYQQALDAFSGPSQSLDAMNEGAKLFTKKPEQIGAELKSLSPGDLEFYKLGAADALRTSIAKTGMGGDEAKRIIGNEYTQRQLRPLFDSDKAYDRFIKSATAENRMFNTKDDQIGNSKSAARLAEDAADGGGKLAGPLLQIGTGAATGEWGLSGMGMLGAGKELWRRATDQNNPAVNAEMARILHTPGIAANRDFLARVMAQKPAPSLTKAATVPLSSMSGAVYPWLTNSGLLGSSAPP